MKNLTIYPAMHTAPKKTDRSLPKAKAFNIPASPETTTADRLLYLKECLDKNVIDESLFRALRDELTYGNRLRN